MKGKLMIVALLLSVVMAVPVFAGPFNDVPETHWAYEAIVKMQEKGIIEGFQGQYRGKQPITRYEAAVIIARVMAAVQNALDGKGLKVDGANGEKVDLSGVVKSDEFEEFKSTVNKLGAEFKDELSALGVRVGAVEADLAAVKEDVNKLKKFQWSGSIRTRIWDAATSWGDLFKKDRTNGQTGADTFTKLNLNVAVNDMTTATVTLWHRDWNGLSLGSTAPSNVFLYGWQDEGKSTLSVREANVKTVGLMDATWTVGRQDFQFGPFGVLVKSPYGSYAPGAIKAEKDMGGLKLTGVVIPVGDKYVAGRAALPIGESGDELGVNVLAYGPGAVQGAFGADLQMNIFKAEIASLAWDTKTENDRALGVVVGADIVSNDKWTLNVKASSFEGQSGDKAAFCLTKGYPCNTGTTWGSYSVMGWEDVEGVFRPGFKGVGVTGSLKVNEGWTVSGEVNKGNDKSPTGFGKVKLATTLSPNVDASVSLIQVGSESNSDSMAIRGEMMVGF